MHRPALKHHPHHFGNHIAGAAHHHGVGHAHIFALRFAFVVQRGVGYGYTADKHGLQARHRRYCAGAPHLHINGFHHGERFFGGEFVRNRPARRARNKAQCRLLRQAVDFHHHAVDFIRQLGAFLRHLLIKCQHAAYLAEAGVVPFRQAEAQCFQIMQLIQMRV